MLTLIFFFFCYKHVVLEAVFGVAVCECFTCDEAHSRFHLCICVSIRECPEQA